MTLPVLNQEAREKVMRLEAELLKMVQCEAPTEHFFAKGVYLRELFIPKGATLTGMIHKFSQINILLKGSMSVLTESGVIHMMAPHIFESPAGVKRAGFAHEDSIWCTIHGTQETDLDKLEVELIAPSFEEFDKLSEPEQLKALEG